MQQKELAALLDVSPAMVSRLAKRGMPTDSLERAQRWRKRHLEPGRVKGNRYNPNQAATAREYERPAVVPALPDVSFFEMESVGELVDTQLNRGNHYGAAIRTWQLRELLRKPAHYVDYPRFSLRVWLALLGYMIHPEAEVRHSANLDECLTPGDFGARVCPEHPWAAHTVIFEACDFDDDAINGYPELQEGVD